MSKKYSNNQILTLVITLLFVFSIFGTVVADGHNDNMKDIVDTAVDADGFNTLVTAVQKSGLVDALKGEGPFTVFAPTDKAFSNLPKGILDTLLANPELLSEVLLYHVVEGKVMAEDVAEMNGAQVETLYGKNIKISITDGLVYINEAKVTSTDIETTNGVIHVIDSVLVPYEDLMDIVDTAIRTGSLNTLVTAVVEAELVGALKGEGPYTVFAPTNEAFAALPDQFLEHLLKDKNVLQSYLLYHVVEGKVMAQDVISLDGVSVNTLFGKNIEVSIKNGSVYIDNSKVIITDIETKNGVIHLIDKVLVP